MFVWIIYIIRILMADTSFAGILLHNVDEKSNYRDTAKQTKRHHPKRAAIINSWN